MKDPVDGTAQVVACSNTPGTPSTSQNCRMSLVVQASGIPATHVEIEDMVRTAKWPWPGQTLPVAIDRADLSRVRIRWDEVPTGREVALQRAFPGAVINVEGTPIAGPESAATSGDDRLALLERLAKLREQGLLSPEESSGKRPASWAPGR